MAMNIYPCSEECGNLTVVKDSPCAECEDETPHVPVKRRNGVERARAFRAGVEVNEFDYAGVN